MLPSEGGSAHGDAAAGRLCAQAVVEGDQRLGRSVLGGEEDAAVGQPQGGLGAQQGKLCGGVRSECDLVQAELAQGGLSGVEASLARGSDEYLGEGQDTGSEWVLRRLKQELDGAGMVSVVIVEVRDKHACVDDDHACQSSRSRSR